MFKGYWCEENNSHYQEKKENLEDISDSSPKNREVLSATINKQELSNTLDREELSEIIDIKEALTHINDSIYLVNNAGKDQWVRGGTALITDKILPEMEENLNYLKLIAYIPPLPLENLGDSAFKARHNLRYPYIAGAMANGITSVQMVESMAKNGMIAFFGAGGLSLSEVEKAIVYLKQRLDKSHLTDTTSYLDYSKSYQSSCLPFGFNFIHSHGDPDFEMALAQLYIKHGVHKVSAAAFMRITLPLVYYRLKGIHRDMEGNIITPYQIIAKVSRVEVARQFFSPPPQKLVSELLNQGLISNEEAQLAQYIPMAQDLTAEADSGGHTDNRPAISLWPTMIALRDELNQKFNYAEPLCVGFAGGISTPESAAAAFQMGAAYILTGSINQSCVEAGTSEVVKSLLAQAEQADVAMAPAADMFEIGARVQVLKRGTMFSVRAEKLYQIYKNYEKIEDVPEKIKQEIEEKYLKATFDQKWQETKEFFRARNANRAIAQQSIKELERAEKEPRHKMALVFRSYLGLSSRWSINGDPDRKMDYQIWCGPSIGAFNQWVKGTYLEKSDNRKVADIALNLLFGASVCTRAGWLRSQGVELPLGAGRFTPIERRVIL
ncbi:MAG: PfaD family polyunsaturated fatty acid/polyketide biosynthesis protein [Desulfamplus sp.]|nr:PfaD family polyunsaturated fatty acid/polyketide biosynthesis protein [Desulfamplus sp.]